MSLFTEAFEPSNLRQLIGNAASCFDHMKLGTSEGEASSASSMEKILAPASPLGPGRGQAAKRVNSSKADADDATLIEPS